MNPAMGRKFAFIRTFDWGLAVASDRGLVVPAIVDAHVKTVRQLAAEVDDIVGKARAGAGPNPMGGRHHIYRVELRLTSGLDEGVPIVNPPRRDPRDRSLK